MDGYFQHVGLSLETIFTADGLALCIKVDSTDYLVAGWWCDFALGRVGFLHTM
jgi:hypothetical protein